MNSGDLPDGYELRYVPRGKNTTHVIFVPSNHTPYEAALCSFTPRFGTPWLGSSSDEEHKRAASNQLCKTCEKHITRLIEAMWSRQSHRHGLVTDASVLDGPATVKRVSSTS